MDRSTCPSGCRRNSSPCRNGRRGALVLFLVLSCLFATPVHAQSRKDLEKKREQLDKQLRTTNNLLEQARKEQNNKQQEVQLINARIAQREALIGTMSSEVAKAEQAIRENEALLASLKEDMERLKAEYARMLRFAYQNRNAYDRLSYVFAAESFAQAFKRSRYLAKIAEHRQRQAQLIAQTEATIAQRLDELKNLRTERSTLLGEQVAAKQELTEDRSEQQASIAGLKREEGRLKDQLRKQKRQKADLDAAIRKAIEAELKPKKNSGTDTKGKGSGKLELDMTPEAKALGADLEKNKGKLPWPVERGVITGRFGTQPHPVLKGITIENNGIDITTEKNAGVRALFRGEVTSVIVLPGAGKAVIVSHGAYRTVYTNLREVNVTKGQKVDTKQVIGTVMTTDDGNIAHIEVWKVTTDGMVKQDPELWLYRN